MSPLKLSSIMGSGRRSIQSFYFLADELRLDITPVIIIKMGQICQRKQEQSLPSTQIQLPRLQGFDQVAFIFTTNKLTRVDSQCLILFTDKKIKVDRNQFLRKCGKSVANKVQEYLDVSLDGERLLVGECKIIDVVVPQLLVNKICLVCLEVWGGTDPKQITGQLQKCLTQTLQKIKQHNITQIAIVEFNSQFGLPSIVAERVLIKAIHNEKKGIKVISFVHRDQVSMVEVKRELTNFGGQLSEKEDRSSKDSSVYY